MAEILFYEKPGCLNNTRQKALLRQLGHSVQARDLLTQSWTAEYLRGFFGQRPVVDWFNRTAPRIKSGEVRPEVLDEQQALALMLADPLLIRRPLIETAAGRVSGFDGGPILVALGLGACPAVDLETCPKSAAQAGDRHGCTPPEDPA